MDKPKVGSLKTKYSNWKGMDDIKRKFYAILDVEALSDMEVYDIGVVVMDKTGKIYSARRWLNSQILYKGNPQLNPKTMYFHNKLNLYREMWKKQPSVRQDWSTIRTQLNQFLEDNDVEVISAYNLGYDLEATAITTQKFLKLPSLFDKQYPVIDIWLVACETLCTRKTYHSYAKANGLVSPAGNVRTTAEAVYGYLHQNPQYVEDHTALEDCFIEAEILTKCLNSHQKMTKWQIVKNPWRFAQKK